MDLNSALRRARDWDPALSTAQDREEDQAMVASLANTIERTRELLQEDVWSDRDPRGLLQRYLDVIEGNHL